MAQTKVEIVKVLSDVEVTFEKDGIEEVLGIYYYRGLVIDLRKCFGEGINWDMEDGFLVSGPSGGASFTKSSGALLNFPFYVEESIYLDIDKAVKVGILVDKSHVTADGGYTERYHLLFVDTILQIEKTASSTFEVTLL